MAENADWSVPEPSVQLGGDILGTTLFSNVQVIDGTGIAAGAHHDADILSIGGQLFNHVTAEEATGTHHQGATHRAHPSVLSAESLFISTYPPIAEASW